MSPPLLSFTKFDVKWLNKGLEDMISGKLIWGFSIVGVGLFGLAFVVFSFCGEIGGEGAIMCFLNVE